MSAIDQLERQVASVATLVEQNEARETPGDLAGRASLSSLRQHLADLRDQLRLAKELREKEVVEFRLKGSSAQDGTIPLRVLAGVARDFSTTLHAASRYLKKGTHGGPVPREIVDTLDLRLAGISSGSTRLFITGRTAPDLFGRSLIEESLRDTFSLLQSEDNPEALTDAVARIGVKGTKAVVRLLDNIANEDLALTMRWQSPKEVEYLWEAEPKGLRALAATLEGFQTVQAPDIDIVGEIVTLSSRDRFVIRDDSGAEYPALVPSDKLDLIRAYHVGQRAKAKLGRSVVENRITLVRKTSFSLVSLSPV